jgi:hypothetical protein
MPATRLDGSGDAGDEMLFRYVNATTLRLERRIEPAGSIAAAFDCSVAKTPVSHRPSPAARITVQSHHKTR